MSSGGDEDYSSIQVSSSRHKDAGPGTKRNNKSSIDDDYTSIHASSVGGRQVDAGHSSNRNSTYRDEFIPLQEVDLSYRKPAHNTSKGPSLKDTPVISGQKHESVIQEVVAGSQDSSFQNSTQQIGQNSQFTPLKASMNDNPKVLVQNSEKMGSSVAAGGPIEAPSPWKINSSIDQSATLKKEFSRHDDEKSSKYLNRFETQNTFFKDEGFTPGIKQNKQGLQKIQMSSKDSIQVMGTSQTINASNNSLKLNKQTKTMDSEMKKAGGKQGGRVPGGKSQHQQKQQMSELSEIYRSAVSKKSNNDNYISRNAVHNLNSQKKDNSKNTSSFNKSNTSKQKSKQMKQINTKVSSFKQGVRQSQKFDYKTPLSPQMATQIISSDKNVKPSSLKEIKSVVTETREYLKNRGFDLCAWGSSTLYNHLIESQGLGEQLSQLPADRLVIVAGNNKSIWDKIQEFKNENESSENLFDEYSRDIAKRIIQDLQAKNHRIISKFANEITKDGLVSFNRLIQALPFGDSEQCFFQNEVHLLFHSLYGNWHAWRFLLIFENMKIVQNPDLIDRKIQAGAELQSKHIKVEEVQKAQHLMSLIQQLDGQGSQSTQASKEASGLWLRVRQVFEIGRKEWMYPIDMLRYHYGNVPKQYFDQFTKDQQELTLPNSDIKDNNEITDAQNLANQAIEDTFGNPHSSDYVDQSPQKQQVRKAGGTENNGGQQEGKSSTTTYVAPQNEVSYMDYTATHDQTNDAQINKVNISGDFQMSQNNNMFNLLKVGSSNIFEKSPPRSAAESATDPQGNTMDQRNQKNLVSDSFNPVTVNPNEVGQQIGSALDSLISNKLDSQQYSIETVGQQEKIMFQNQEENNANGGATDQIVSGIIKNMQQTPQNQLKVEFFQNPSGTAKHSQQLTTKRPTNSIKDWTNSSNEELAFSGRAELIDPNSNSNSQYIKQQYQKLNQQRNRPIDRICKMQTQMCDNLNNYRTTNFLKSSAMNFQKLSAMSRKSNTGLKFQFINRGNIQTLRNPMLVRKDEDKYMTVLSKQSNYDGQTLLNIHNTHKQIYDQQMAAASKLENEEASAANEYNQQEEREEQIMAQEENVKSKTIEVNDRNMEFDGSRFTISNAQLDNKQKQNSRNNLQQIVTPPSSNKQTQRHQDSKIVDNRTINFIQSMRKNNINYPWGYRKAQLPSSNRQLAGLSTAQGFQQSRDMVQDMFKKTDDGVPTSLAPSGPLKENFSTSSQARMSNSQHHIQSINNLSKYYGRQMPRNKTSYMEKRQAKQVTKRPTGQIAVRSFINSELHQRQKAQHQDSEDGHQNIHSIYPSQTKLSNQTQPQRASDEKNQRKKTGSSQHHLKQFNTLASIGQPNANHSTNNYLVESKKYIRHMDQQYSPYLISSKSKKVPTRQKSQEISGSPRRSPKVQLPGARTNLSISRSPVEQFSIGMDSKYLASNYEHKLSNTQDDFISKLNLSNLGLSRAQILQTTVNEVVEKTKAVLEAKTQGLTQYQEIQLRDKIINAKRLIEMQEDLKKVERRARKRKDADSVKAFHNMQNQYISIKKKLEYQNTERNVIEFIDERNRDMTDRKNTEGSLQDHSSFIEYQKAGVLSPDDRLSKGNQLSMYSSHYRLIQQNKRAPFLKNQALNYNLRAYDNNIQGIAPRQDTDSKRYHKIYSQNQISRRTTNRVKLPHQSEQANQRSSTGSTGTPQIINIQHQKDSQKQSSHNVVMHNDYAIYTGSGKAKSNSTSKRDLSQRDVTDTTQRDITRWGKDDNTTDPTMTVNNHDSLDVSEQEGDKPSKESNAHRQGGNNMATSVRKQNFDQYQQLKHSPYIKQQVQSKQRKVVPLKQGPNNLRQGNNSVTQKSDGGQSHLKALLSQQNPESKALYNIPRYMDQIGSKYASNKHNSLSPFQKKADRSRIQPVPRKQMIEIQVSQHIQVRDFGSVESEEMLYSQKQGGSQHPMSTKSNNYKQLSKIYGKGLTTSDKVTPKSVAPSVRQSHIGSMKKKSPAPSNKQSQNFENESVIKTDSVLGDAAGGNDAPPKV